MFIRGFSAVQLAVDKRRRSPHDDSAAQEDQFILLPASLLAISGSAAKTYLKLYSTLLEYRQLRREWLTSSFTLLVKQANRRQNAPCCQRIGLQNLKELATLSCLLLSKSSAFQKSLTLAVVAMTAEYLVLNKTKRKYQMSQLNGL